MKKEPDYILLLTENEKDLIINALYMGSNIHGCINHPYVSNRMSNIADRLSKLHKQAERDLKRPQGKWIYPEKTDKEKGYGGYCSNCKCDMPIFVEDWKQKYCETKFCPNCGAKMKGGAK